MRIAKRPAAAAQPPKTEKARPPTKHEKAKHSTGGDGYDHGTKQGPAASQMTPIRNLRG